MKECINCELPVLPYTQVEQIKEDLCEPCQVVNSPDTKRLNKKLSKEYKRDLATRQ